jgi:mannosyltransferase
MLVVHSHLHPRRTGVTAHTERMVEAQQAQGEVRWLGELLPARLPRIGWGALWRRSGAEPVVFHAHRNQELVRALAWRALGRRLAIVATYHGTRPGWFSRALLRQADAVVTLNDEVAARVGVPSTVVPHGVPLDRFAPPADRRAAFRTLGLPGEYAVGVVGRVRPSKGQGDFVAALAPLLESHPAWSAVLVGLVKPSEHAWAEGLVAQTGGRLYLAGEAGDVERWYRGLDVVVQASHVESFSLVTLEAMASGCCVVATRVGAAERLIEDGVSGFLVDVGDVAGLRRRLEALMGDAALVARVGAAARARAQATFGLDAEARALWDVYRAALARRGLL